MVLGTSPKFGLSLDLELASPKGPLDFKIPLRAKTTSKLQF